MNEQEGLKKIRAALERDRSFDIHHNPVDIAFDGRTAILRGEVRRIQPKRMAVRVVRSLPFVQEVIDLLTVRAAEPREDGAIKDSLLEAFTHESAFYVCNINIWNGTRSEPMRDKRDETSCCVNIMVEDGVVTLAGSVISLSHKRLAGVLAWWAPGTRNVINQLEAVPGPQFEDDDGEITDAIILALEKDPLVHGDQIRAVTTNRVVTLYGMAGNEQERQMAEDDVWYLPEVEGVINQIAVRS